jgi:hypothetical protein
VSRLQRQETQEQPVISRYLQARQDKIFSSCKPVALVAQARRQQGRLALLVRNGCTRALVYFKAALVKSVQRVHRLQTVPGQLKRGARYRRPLQHAARAAAMARAQVVPSQAQAPCQREQAALERQAALARMVTTKASRSASLGLGACCTCSPVAQAAAASTAQQQPEPVGQQPMAVAVVAAADHPSLAARVVLVVLVATVTSSFHGGSRCPQPSFQDCLILAYSTLGCLMLSASSQRQATSSRQ